MSYRSRKIRAVRDILDDPFSPDAVFRAQRIVLRFLSKWRDTVGDSMAEVTSPYRFSKGVLFVACYDSLTIAELPYLKEELINKLKAVSGELSDIRFTLAKHPKPSSPRETAAAKAAGHESEWIREVSGRAGDEEIGEKFRAMLKARENSSR